MRTLKQLVRIATAALLLTTVGSAVLAQLTQPPVPAVGTDMWTGAMGRAGLFRPHAHNCSALEAFVAVQAGSGTPG